MHEVEKQDLDDSGRKATAAVVAATDNATVDEADDKEDTDKHNAKQVVEDRSDEEKDVPDQ